VGFRNFDAGRAAVPSEASTDRRLEMHRSPHYFALAVVAALVLVGSASAAHTKREAHTKRTAPIVRVDFVKHVVDPANFVFEGTVSGDVTGGLVSRLVSLDGQTGKNLHITFDWIVSAGDRSFTARTSGIWNQKTNAVVMTGKVIRGYLLGAEVHEQGRLVEPSTLTFEGSLWLAAKPA
jgi:hypothetical protein